MAQLNEQSSSLQVNQVIDAWAFYVLLDLIKVMLKKQVGRTGALQSSLHYTHQYSGAEIGAVKFQFLYYGVFTDMGVGNGQKLGDVKGNQVIYRETGIKGRKAKMWYSKTIFPEANTLAQILADKYGQVAVNNIKEGISRTINMQA